MEAGVKYLMLILTFSFSFGLYAQTNISESLVEGGVFYVGDVFGKQDYISHANVKLKSYFIMKKRLPTLFISRCIHGQMLTHTTLTMVAMGQSTKTACPRNVMAASIR